MTTATSAVGVWEEAQLKQCFMFKMKYKMTNSLDLRWYYAALWNKIITSKNIFTDFISKTIHEKHLESKTVFGLFAFFHLHSFRSNSGFCFAPIYCCSGSSFLCNQRLFTSAYTK